MFSIQWLESARGNLATIIDYIAERNVVAAADLLDDIERAVSQLAGYPYLYKPGRVAGTREIVVHPNYIVVYRVRMTVIEIVAVLHARQQYPADD